MEQINPLVETGVGQYSEDDVWGAGWKLDWCPPTKQTQLVVTVDFSERCLSDRE